MSLVGRIASPSESILELGCNVGRNLNALFSSGYQGLSGVEINAEAVELLRKVYPEMASHAQIHNDAIEDVIKSFPDASFDVVFTMAVLEHLPRKSEWVFREMARIAKCYLITIEDEEGRSWRHFPRNYKVVFESVGMRQIEARNCSGVEGLGASFYSRIFRKPPESHSDAPKLT